MTALIYTESDSEYELFARILHEEIPEIAVTRAPNDGHCHAEQKYTLVVDSICGALGMEIALGHQDQKHTRVIWISDDRYFTRMAIRAQLFDFIVRPFTGEQFRKSVRYFTNWDLERWPLILPLREWSCVCEAKKTEGICPLLKRD